MRNSKTEDGYTNTCVYIYSYICLYIYIYIDIHTYIHMCMSVGWGGSKYPSTHTT